MRPRAFLFGHPPRFRQAVHRGKRDLLLLRVFSRGLAERFGRFLYVQNVIGNLKCPANVFTEAAKAPDVFDICARTERAAGDRCANQRCSLRAMDVLKHLGRHGLAFCLKVGDLAADHSVYGSRGGGNFRNHSHTPRPISGSSGDCFECQGEQRITREDCDGIAKLLVARRLATAKVVVVERGKIIMDQRIGVNKLDRASGIQRRGDVGTENPRSFQT